MALTTWFIIKKKALRLSQKLDKTGRLTEEAFASTLETMKSFAYMCRLYNADKTIAVATAAIRSAPNGPELTRLVEAETGITLHIITGNTEPTSVIWRYQYAAG